MPSRDQPGEDKRLTAYRSQVQLANLAGDLRVLCGGVGLLALFMFAIMSFLRIPDGGTLLWGGLLAAATRFGKVAFFLACLWGLIGPWSGYFEENAKECRRRKEMLARIEADPDWFRKRYEKRRQWRKEQEDLEAKLGMGNHPDPEIRGEGPSR